MDGTHDKKSHLVMEEEKKLDESQNEEGTSAAPAENKPEGDSSKDDKKNVVSAEEHLRTLREKEALIRDLAKARKKLREQRLTAASKPAEDSSEDEDQEGDEEKPAQKKQADADILSPLKERYQKKAWNRFVTDFSDFAPDKDPDGEKQEALLTAIKQFSLDGDAFDAEDFYGVYKKAYAVVHTDDILKKEKRARESASRQKMDDADFVADSATPSSERNIGETAGITTFDRKLAKETGKSPEEVAKLRRQFEDSHVSGL